MAIENVLLASLIEDYDIYPRHAIDSVHISDLARAIEAGQELPPIVADAATKRIVDGFHRRRAFLKVFGDHIAASVDLREYKSEAALFLEAIRLNSSHGRKLDRHDQARIVIRCRELQLPDETIALTLHVPPVQITQLALRVVVAPSGPMPSKRGLEHLHGQSVSQAQADVISGLRSGDAGRCALELERMLTHDLVDLSDERTLERLRSLSGALEKALANIVA